LNQELSSDVNDIDLYAASLQSTVYDNFGATFGILNNRQSTQDMLYKDMTAKQLKKLLSQAKTDAKNNIPNGEDISALSKTIRRRLTSRISVSTSSAEDERNLKNKFCKTCRTIFSSLVKVCPSFSVEECTKYFTQILTQTRQSKIFTAPSWLPEMQRPTKPYDETLIQGGRKSSQ